MKPVLYPQKQFRTRKFIDAGHHFILGRVEGAKGIVCCCDPEDLPEEVDFIQMLQEGGTLFVPFAAWDSDDKIEAADGTELPIPEGADHPSSISDETLRAAWEPIHMSDMGCMGFLIRRQGDAVEIQSGIYDEGDFVSGRVVEPRADMGVLEGRMVAFVRRFIREGEAAEAEE